jgi:hypothetical protein
VGDCVEDVLLDGPWWAAEDVLDVVGAGFAVAHTVAFKRTHGQAPSTWRHQS